LSGFLLLRLLAEQQLYLIILQRFSYSLERLIKQFLYQMLQLAMADRTTQGLTLLFCGIDHLAF
jgi:hypothetical protein